MASLVRSVDIDRPVEEVYEQWARLDRLPELLGSVIAVDRLDDRRSHWVVRIRGEVREFDAVTTEEVPGLRLAWRATGATPHAGVVTFHRLTDRSSRVTVQLDWAPAGFFDRIGDRLGLVRRAVDADLATLRDRLAATPGAEPALDLRDAPPEEGRDAESPAEIPPAGWLQVVKRTMKQLKSDNVPVVSGGVAFYSFLALVPALAAVVSIYGIVADPADVGRQLNSFFGALPRDAAQLLRSQVRSITAQQASGLGVAAVVGILGSLWSASKGMQALIASLNIAYDEEETRKGLRLKVITLGMTVALAVVTTGLIAAMAVAGALSSHLPAAGQWAVSVLRWPLLFAVLAVGLAVLYRYAPDRDDADWRWVTPGALVAAALVVLGSFGFALYVNAFGSYSETYGSLGAIVVLLLWLNLTAYVVVFGAELDAELERQTARDTTTGSDRPMGTREAYAADTVAV